MSKILITDAIGESGIEFLKKQGYDIEYYPEVTYDELLNAVGDADALIVRGRTKVTREIINKASKLKVIGKAGAGVDNIDVTEARRHGIVVVNAPGATSEAVAEHTMALLLSLVRHIPEVSHALSEGKWEKSSYTAIELHGKTIGVIGFGHIGNRVAQLGVAFGMHVLVATRTVHGSMQKELEVLGGKYVSLKELLKNADVVTVHIPATKDTEKLIGKNEFAHMKPTAYFINTARAAVVDESALIDALKDNRLAGAALDVFSTEPLSIDSGLLDAPNIILTPHVASVSPEGRERASLTVCEDVACALEGKPAINQL
ncbi:MAG TPA: hydroxyacid dehydrogenase [Patescibacteria group bacterium]|nr:hydroxyacid dehydrogenase [Patescibacteria group bacterium]